MKINRQFDFGNQVEVVGCAPSATPQILIWAGETKVSNKDLILDMDPHALLN
jgi:hypothetical protein